MKLTSLLLGLICILFVNEAIAEVDPFIESLVKQCNSCFSNMNHCEKTLTSEEWKIWAKKFDTKIFKKEVNLDEIGIVLIPNKGVCMIHDYHDQHKLLKFLPAD